MYFLLFFVIYQIGVFFFFGRFLLIWLDLAFVDLKSKYLNVIYWWVLNLVSLTWIWLFLTKIYFCSHSVNLGVSCNFLIWILVQIDAFFMSLFQLSLAFLLLWILLIAQICVSLIMVWTGYILMVLDLWVIYMLIEECNFFFRSWFLHVVVGIF